MDLMSVLGWLSGAILVVLGIAVQMPDAEKGIEFGFNWACLSNFVDIPSIIIGIDHHVAPCTGAWIETVKTSKKK